MGIQESKKRTVKWDNAKAGLIFLVVFGHFAEIFCEDKDFYKSMFFFIYSFHMPAFIFITGMLGRKRVEKLDKYKLIHKSLAESMKIDRKNGFSLNEIIKNTS